MWAFYVHSNNSLIATHTDAKACLIHVVDISEQYTIFFNLTLELFEVSLICRHFLTGTAIDFFGLLFDVFRTQISGKISKTPILAEGSDLSPGASE